MSELTPWYGCRVCGEMRRFPFEANVNDPGCRCPPADRVRTVEAPARSSNRRSVEGPDLRVSRVGSTATGRPEQVTFEDSAEVLTENDCLALLQSGEVGRVAFDVEDTVEVLPVNYGTQGKIIVFRTGVGTKLAAVPKTAVAFEVDSWDPESGVGWSVVAKGRAEEVTTNLGRVAEHLRRVPLYPAAPGDRSHWIAIKPSEITGRRFHVPPAGRGRGQGQRGQLHAT